MDDIALLKDLKYLFNECSEMLLNKNGKSEQEIRDHILGSLYDIEGMEDPDNMTLINFLKTLIANFEITTREDMKSLVDLLLESSHHTLNDALLLGNMPDSIQ